jgi:hypothetical protein
VLILLFISQVFAATIGPTPFPVFLKEGYSSILEFEEAPTQVVLGDQNLFQVEKLEKSIVIKPLVTYASTNMFVYFKTKSTRLFLLSASEDNEPTFYKKFETLVMPKPTNSLKYIRHTRGVFRKSAAFDKKKDYFTVDFLVSADSKSKVIPNWDEIRLKYKDRYLIPSKLWSERKEAQRDSNIKARLVFTKPNIPLDLKQVSVVVPIKGESKAMILNLRSHQ